MHIPPPVLADVELLVEAEVEVVVVEVADAELLELADTEVLDVVDPAPLETVEEGAAPPPPVVELSPSSPQPPATVRITAAHSAASGRRVMRTSFANMRTPSASRVPSVWRETCSP
jgi:hypothetical protein